MKKVLLLTLFIVALTIATRAQEKGTNTLGLGVSFFTEKSEFNGQTTENNNQWYSIGYGRFIKDNQRLGISFFHLNRDYLTGATENGYGGSIESQYYYPLFKKFYAFAGGNAAYSYFKQEDSDNIYNIKRNEYSLGASGGATYFVSKRFAFEANLLSASIGYAEQKQAGINGDARNATKTTYFNLSTNGAISNLGFKIYFLF
jgi:hypothetical protein